MERGCRIFRGNRRRAGEPGPRRRDRPRPLCGAGAGAGDRVPGGGRVGVYLARAPVLIQGRVELLWYVREQSISIDYHRYGNLSIREGEEGMEVS